MRAARFSAQMRTVRWLNFAVLLLCLLGQAVSIDLGAAPVAPIGETALIETSEASTLIDGLLSEAPLSVRLNKAGAVLSSSRMAPQQFLVLSLKDPSLTPCAISSLIRLDSLIRGTADNRSPPLS